MLPSLRTTALVAVVICIVAVNLLELPNLMNIVASPSRSTFEAKGNSTVMMPATSNAMLSSMVKDYGNSSWCPNAVCHTSRMCQPCKRRFLVIFASGRSASTTLTWMVDSLPGIRMSGEDVGFLRGQFLQYKTTFQHPEFKKQQGTLQSPRSPHFRFKLPEGSPSCLLQTGIEIMNPPAQAALPIGDEDYSIEASTIIGFKTIQSVRPKDSIEHIREFAAYLKSNLPCAKFLINVRSNSKATARSRKSAFVGMKDMAMENATAMVEKEREKLVKLYKALGTEQAYLLDSTKWTKDVRILNRAVSWLGFNSTCHFRGLLQYNIKGGYGKGKKTKFGPNAFSASSCTPL